MALPLLLKKRQPEHIVSNLIQKFKTILEKTLQKSKSLCYNRLITYITEGFYENSILWDCHMHSSFSADSDTDMENMIKGAISRGLEGVCFTEHLDPDYPPTPDQQIFHLDLDAYARRLSFLREKYKDSIMINFGIEYGLQPHLKENLKNHLKLYPFDFVIGSSHVIHGSDPYYGEYFKGREESQGYMEYFESSWKNLDVFSEMDVYGHIDYIVRYGPNKNLYYSYERYQDILDEIRCTRRIKPA
mgnify:CR=1 FL=1